MSEVVTAGSRWRTCLSRGTVEGGVLHRGPGYWDVWLIPMLEVVLAGSLSRTRFLGGASGCGDLRPGPGGWVVALTTALEVVKAGSRSRTLFPQEGAVCGYLHGGPAVGLPGVPLCLRRSQRARDREPARCGKAPFVVICTGIPELGCRVAPCA